MKRVTDGRAVSFTTWLRVGRAPDAGLRIDRAVVSLEHASVRWVGDGWELRDLGSRNGTVVDGVPLARGEAARLDLGSRVTFGDPDESWEFIDADPPDVHAEPLDGGELASGRDGLLVLPGPERPELSIHQDLDGTWRAERADGEQGTVEDGDVLEAGGRRWRLHLPETLEGTPAFQDTPTLDSVVLRLAVTRDEEVVRVSFVHAGRVTTLEPRWHGYVLLTLARLRREAGALPVGERGWVDRDRLLRMLRMDTNGLDVAVHKARQQLLDAGVRGAAGVVEVRRGQRRLGTDRFELVTDP